MTQATPDLNLILKELEEIQAADVTVIDVHEQTTVTDYMIVATGRSSRHVKAIAEHVMLKLKEHGLPSISDHGLDTGYWALVDFGDYVLHIMEPDARAFYNLESLWQQGK